MKKKLFEIFLISICFVSISNASVEDLMKEANEDFRQNKFSIAIQKYEQILAEDIESTALYYNLGNAYYRTGRLGFAILNYEKGLKLSPYDEDLNYNLQLANVRTVDKIKNVPKLFLVEWYDALLASTGIFMWSVLVIAFYLLLLSSILFYYISRKRFVQKISFYLGSSNLIFLVISVSFLVVSLNREASSNYGVLTETEVTVKQSPDTQSNDVFVIHEGIKFEINDELNDWSKIKLSDGKVGWLPKSTFGNI
ncbi:MAG: tetratricopeptide repeat protein [Bacteroidetes bacterium]|nr:tetratricopeptide repeat protein [Bacteroidota bacterium]MBU2508140.1 tetratricopeptide repeat protein [Bacteroidota bacterium]